MSTTSPAVPLAPKRRRGHMRVAAILEAAEQLFAEKGYEAATMTEIAARSKTAIGSLYRFFPNKDVLADALLADYVEKIFGCLDRIAAEAPGLTPRGLAEALVAYRIELKDHRRVATALVEAGGDMEGRRGDLSAVLRARLAAILRGALPWLDEGRAAEMVRVVQHVLKVVSESSPDERAIAADVTDLLEVYFTKR
ncbi:MAG TPA: helix-turn-helix domain-containing protein [Magnetospirillaceae bacterium]|nr:helix-turn-helix domain-containing protein [Magnetospirillaceae bacterium]